MKFKVRIEEITTIEVEVIARNKQEAQSKAYENYLNCDYNLLLEEADNFRVRIAAQEIE